MIINKNKIFGVLIVGSLLYSSACAKNNIDTAPLQNNVSRGTLNISQGRTRNYKSKELPNKYTPTVDDVDFSQTEFEAINSQTEVRAESLAELVKSLEGIEDSSVIITGKTAIIGIDLKTEVNEGKIIEIKKSVEKAVKTADPEITHVAVTATPELFERIIDISERDSLEKKELNKLKDNDILFRATPTI